MCRLRNKAIRDYQESVITGQTPRGDAGGLSREYVFRIPSVS